MAFHISRRTTLHFAAMVIIILGAFGWHAQAERVHATPIDAPLLVNNRSQFRVCLQLSSRLASKEQAAAKLARALATLKQQRATDWQKAGYGNVPILERGCPGARLPSSAQVYKDTEIGNGITDNPSPYRTAIFVVDDSEAQSLLGERQATSAAFEIMCDAPEPNAIDRNCGVVTSGLVVRASFLDNPDFIDPYLSLATGFAPRNIIDHPPDVVPTK